MMSASRTRYWGCVFLKNSAPRGRKTVAPERDDTVEEVFDLLFFGYII
jgi:hypothetical protein